MLERVLQEQRHIYVLERVIGESDDKEADRSGDTSGNNGRGPLLDSPAPDNQGCVSLGADGILKCVKGERNG